MTERRRYSARNAGCVFRRSEAQFWTMWRALSPGGGAKRRESGRCLKRWLGVWGLSRGDSYGQNKQADHLPPGWTAPEAPAQRQEQHDEPHRSQYDIGAQTRPGEGNRYPKNSSCQFARNGMRLQPCGCAWRPCVIPVDEGPAGPAGQKNPVAKCPQPLNLMRHRRAERGGGDETSSRRWGGGG